MANPVPTITFQVDLTLLVNENFKTKTSESLVGQSSPDVANLAQAPKNLSTFLPGVNLNNKASHHGDTFVKYGKEAIYLKNTYGQGYAPAERAYLKIISVT
jgi:hypothetical protein